MFYFFSEISIYYLYVHSLEIALRRPIIRYVSQNLLTRYLFGATSSYFHVAINLDLLGIFVIERNAYFFDPTD